MTIENQQYDNGPLLSVKELAVGTIGQDPLVLIRNLTFCLEAGEIMGVAGQSGAGKTLSACAIGALLPSPMTPLGGEVFFRGRKLALTNARDPGFVRGRDLLFLFQSPLSILNPTMRTGLQVTTALRTAFGFSRREAEQRAREAWGRCGLDSGRFNDYPFQLSGGQRQRVLLAMVAGLSPRLLIADEPTAGQDEENRNLLLNLLKQLCIETHMAAIVISHDLRVLLNLTDKLLVLYRGEQVEMGPTSEMLEDPCHFHTRELVSALHFIQRGSWEKSF